MGKLETSKQFRPVIFVFYFVTLLFLLAFLANLLFPFLTFRKFKTTNNPEDIYISHAAHNLPKNESIFVWVMTAPTYHNTRIPAINATWLNRLKHGVIFTSKPLADERIPFRTVFKDFDDSYESLFHKTKFGFYHAYTSISDKFDWYIKSDDDSYIVTENLEKYLKTLDPSKPIYAGFRLKPFLSNGYNSGSVYILSRAAVKIFVEELYNNSVRCPYDNIEDRGMGRCLANVGIYPIPTRDSNNKGRFQLSNAYETFQAKTKPEDYEYYYKDSHNKGFDEFSPELISLHHMTPAEMITSDLFLYRITKST